MTRFQQRCNELLEHTDLDANELSVGDIVINEDHTIVEVHNRHASLAVRSFNSKDITASIIES